MESFLARNLAGALTPTKYNVCGNCGANIVTHRKPDIGDNNGILFHTHFHQDLPDEFPWFEKEVVRSTYEISLNGMEPMYVSTLELKDG